MEDNKFMQFLEKYTGAIVGTLIGILLLFIPHFQTTLVYIGIVIGCGFLGAYVQKNKPSVKEKLKKFIDKM